MTNDKASLIQQMEQQRFLPLTEKTPALYDAFQEKMDPQDPDDLSRFLFYKGEYCFRIGNLDQALNLLNRCLQAPKTPALRQFDALSYNIIGLVYGYLRQESIAIHYLMLARTLCTELSLSHERAVCCANLGILYGQIGLYEKALAYHEEALAHLNQEAADACNHSAYNLRVLCHAYRGLLYCKSGEPEKAFEVSRIIDALIREDGHLFYDAAVINLNIRLYEVRHDLALLRGELAHMQTLVESPMDFLELSEFYFDVCDYLLETKLAEESASLLSYIERFTSASPLVFLQYETLLRKAVYSRAFLSEAEYQKVCSQLILLRPRFLEEQSDAKLHSLEYTERTHQTRLDSQMYLEKSRIDQMTGLLNKYTIQFLVAEDLARNVPCGRQSAMLLIDLDHFKQINDTFGYLTGDTFLSRTGSTILEYFKGQAMCGRIGGDEFLVYISDASDHEFVQLQAEMLRQELYRQTSERNIMITIQASIGIAYSSEYCYDYESLFSAADSALYRAKIEGRGRVVVA